MRGAFLLSRVRIPQNGVVMMEKYIFCPSCNTLTVHARLTGEKVGWLCENCNPSLYWFTEEEGDEE